MVQHRTMLKVADNSGAKALLVVQPLGGSGKRKATLGEVVVGVVKGANPNGQVKDAEVVRIVIVRTKKEVRRTDGSYIKFDENAVVLVDKAKSEPLAGRIFGPIPREVVEAGFQTIGSNASEIV